MVYLLKKLIAVVPGVQDRLFVEGRDGKVRDVVIGETNEYWDKVTLERIFAVIIVLLAFYISRILGVYAAYWAFTSDVELMGYWRFYITTFITIFKKRIKERFLDVGGEPYIFDRD